jgi:hypothetical protein
MKSAAAADRRRGRADGAMNAIADREQVLFANEPFYNPLEFGVTYLRGKDTNGLMANFGFEF